MNAFSSGPITQFQTTSPDLYAFAITGHVDDDAAEDLAKYMNAAFDAHDGKVNMLLDLSAFTGSDWDSFLDGDVITSRFRALKHVDKYAVIGAPEGAARMISIMDKVIPVQARAFAVEESDAAWAWVGEARATA